MVAQPAMIAITSARSVAGSTDAAARVPALDLLRVAAVAAVIAIHVIAWAGAEGDEAESWRRTLDALARVGVPAFVLLSGVLFGRSGARP